MALDKDTLAALAALESSLDESEDEIVAGYYTQEQLCKETGYGRHKIRKMIASGLESGTVEMIELRKKNARGVMTPRPYYKFI